MSATALALQENVKVQTLTRVLAELEAESLISRQPHQSDARQSILVLESAGKHLLRGEMNRRESSIAQALESVLTLEEQEQILAACKLIDRVTSALGLDNAEANAIKADAAKTDAARWRACLTGSDDSA